MAQWGNEDTAADSVTWGVSNYKTPANTANQTAFFENDTVGDFIDGVAVGQFGVTADEIANTSSEDSFAAHAGWNVKTVGTGSLASVEISNGGTGYANDDIVIIGDAMVSIVTDDSGVIVEATIEDAGSGFTEVNPEVEIDTETGTDAVLVATAGGRAGRVSYETLVAMGSLA